MWFGVVWCRAIFLFLTFSRISLPILFRSLFFSVLMVHGMLDGYSGNAATLANCTGSSAISTSNFRKTDWVEQTQPEWRHCSDISWFYFSSLLFAEYNASVAFVVYKDQASLFTDPCRTMGWQNGECWSCEWWWKTLLYLWVKHWECFGSISIRSSQLHIQLIPFESRQLFNLDVERVSYGQLNAGLRQRLTDKWLDFRTT
jgi:hypothetical protein